MNFPIGPLRVTADQWADISEHYDQGEPDEPECKVCGNPLNHQEVDFGACDACVEDGKACRECGEPADDGEGWNGRCGVCADRAEARNAEPLDEDCMAEDYNRAVDEIAGMYPKPDDHDRRFMDQYDTANGDDGQEL